MEVYASVDREIMTETIRSIGHYISDNAECFVLIECSDLFLDDVSIRMKRRKLEERLVIGEEMIISNVRPGFNDILAEALAQEKIVDEKNTVTLSVEAANALRHSVGRSISHLQNIYEIIDAELQGTDFKDDLDKTFCEWRKDR